MAVDYVSEQEKTVDQAMNELITKIKLDIPQRKLLRITLMCMYDLGRTEYARKTAHRKPIGKYDLEWNKLNQFDSLKQAALDVKMTSAAISRSIKRDGIVAGKFRYKFIDYDTL